MGCLFETKLSLCIQKVSQETCLKACRLWKWCKYVSFEPVVESCHYMGQGQCAPTKQTGICTSFSACGRKERVRYQTTWVKEIITPSPECRDQNSKRWCTMKSKQGMCTRSSVAKKCERTCGICDRRRLQLRTR